MTRSILLAVALLLTFTLNVSAQSAPESRKECDPGPITALLNLQTELALTPEQVVRLTEIDEEMARRNEHLIAELVEVRRKIRLLGHKEDLTGAERILYDDYVDIAKPLIKKISHNNALAMKEVGATLTQVQKDTIEQRLKEKEAFRDGRGNVSHCPADKG